MTWEQVAALGPDASRATKTVTMYQLYIANKNYSSWSLRPWVLMREPIFRS